MHNKPLKKTAIYGQNATIIIMYYKRLKNIQQKKKSSTFARQNIKKEIHVQKHH